MAVTLLTQDDALQVDAEVQGDHAWLAPDDIARATGWRIEARGLCRGAVCMPVADAARAELVRGDGRLDLAVLARLRGQPIVRDAAGTAWALGHDGEARASVRRSLEAPDFALPDLAGRVHRLSEHRGRKVLLASWASW
jgi:hypothetical protein